MTEIIHVIPLIHLLSIVVIAYVTFQQIRSKKYFPKIRDLEPINAIPEMIGRSVEMGRPVLFSVGGASLRTRNAALAQAGFSILSYVLDQSIDLGAEVIIIINSADHIPLIRGLYEEAYIGKGKPQDMNMDNLIFIAQGTWARISGMTNIIETRKPGAFIFPGSAASSDAVIYGEHAARVGAMSMSGMTNVFAYPYATICFDYTLLGEDVLAAGCYLTNDPMMTGNIWSGDIYRYFLIAIMVIGLLATWLRIDVSWLFTM